jgi:hypothetical protein
VAGVSAGNWLDDGLGSIRPSLSDGPRLVGSSRVSVVLKNEVVNPGFTDGMSAGIRSSSSSRSDEGDGGEGDSGPQVGPRGGKQHGSEPGRLIGESVTLAPSSPLAAILNGDVVNPGLADWLSAGIRG